MPAKFEVYKGRKGEFRLKAANGGILATGEVEDTTEEKAVVKAKPRGRPKSK